MAHTHPIDTDDGAVPAAVRRFFRNRFLEAGGVIIFVAAIAIALTLASWSVEDPSLNHAIDAEPQNWLGYPGAVTADELMQLLGLGVLSVIAVPMAWAVRFLSHEGLSQPIKSVLSFVLGTFLLSGFLGFLPIPANWALASGLGGNVGDIISSAVWSILSLGLKGVFAQFLGAAIIGFAAFTALSWASGISSAQAIVTTRLLSQYGNDALSALIGAIQHWRLKRASQQASSVKSKAKAKAPEPPEPKAGVLAGLLSLFSRGNTSDDRVEPRLDRKSRSKEPRLSLPPFEEEEDGEQAEEIAGAEEEAEAGNADEIEYGAEIGDDGRPTPKVTRLEKPIKPGQKIKKDKQPGFKFAKPSEFELPELTLLAEPKKTNRGSDLSDEALEQNARMLEGVLEDFGVKGQIINVRPGPVVTLYELEPAPGIKSSRVISLADDIARSMSAISARVAVVSGRNAIGIELPNTKRETVYLRELLASEAFEKTGQNLAMALGKNIGGEPIFADLARMPHLLIAGTTGSGKSVGINTMILSLLYRLPPDRCKLIMIDPKMLELSVYEGIPHLLSPVVTDPRKAVVALKWAVREMEDRYRKMSKVGVRNIDGYNARAKQAMAKGEVVSRTVQTGFDPETGEPIFEQEQMEMAPMPYIVVIIDEMADLMMVAGKDIEGAVQRLAQMARAAGIHVVMATQRPSVDVITGTIKANFPTRISFQVTSKIDSRTILGEQGAEQLLGQGDMLYMAGGGRISRLHGPFVSDGEVEKIVKHLKSQGAPEYVEAVTEEPEEGAFGDGGAADGGGMPDGSGDELYDQAVQVVLRDKKVSTSYIQRRLQVGYNKAASLIERMEKEGLISAANATGKREILVAGDSARD
jgi:S-DNA-T family DNA segregation ATPase FtsK/SpoIIIE